MTFLLSAYAVTLAGACRLVAARKPERFPAAACLQKIAVPFECQSGQRLISNGDRSIIGNDVSSIAPSDRRLHFRDFRCRGWRCGHDPLDKRRRRTGWITNAYPDGESNANINAYRNTNCNTDNHGDADGYSNTDCDRERHGNTYSNTHRHSNINSHSHTYCYSDGHSDSYSNAATDAYTEEWANAEASSNTTSTPHPLSTIAVT